MSTNLLKRPAGYLAQYCMKPFTPSRAGTSHSQILLGGQEIRDMDTTEILRNTYTHGLTTCSI